MDRKEKFTPGPWTNIGSEIVPKSNIFFTIAEVNSYSEDTNFNADLIAAAPEMYGSNEAALTEIDKIIPALLKPCRLCARICSVCAECDTQRAVHAARTMQRRITNLQKKARGEE